MKQKIAFIIQRYGIEVNGGAEYHCRIVAERLKDLYDVEVLTSCAEGYQDWANTYPAGESYINDVKVTRFPSVTLRNTKGFKSVGRHLKKRKPHQKALRFLGLLNTYEKLIPFAATESDEDDWVTYQGPNIPGLIDHLKQHHNQYDALIFFTYLYYPTIFGIRVDPESSILVPTAHDEPTIYVPLFKKLFKTPKAILYNTVSEKNFVNGMFNNQNIYSDIVGIGVEPNETHYPPQLPNGINADTKYIIYIGRIEASKGCKKLIDYYLKYKSITNNDLKLVFVGQPLMPILKSKDIIVAGFVDENVKITLLKNAVALVIPSLYESLSMVTIESMAYGVPVIANQKCEVLKDHIDNSKAGFLYLTFKEFKSAIDTLLNGDAKLFTTLSNNAKSYVAQNYKWDVVIDKYIKAISYIAG